MTVETLWQLIATGESESVEKYGSGIKRVLEAFSKYNLQRPIFEEIQNGFKVMVSKNTQKIATHEQIFALLEKP